MSDMNGRSQEIRAFVEAHPDGWNHDDWLGFLHYMEQLGYDASDPDGIGLALEQERLRHLLESSSIRGLGPKRIAAITTEYPALHKLREADGREIASKAGLPRALADEIAQRVR